MCVIFSLAASISLLFWRQTVPETKRDVDYTKSYRLPNNVVPYHYVLEVQPYLTPKNSTFDGKVDIVIYCREETDTIVLHSHGLSLNSESIVIRSIKEGVRYEIESMTVHEPNEFLILKFTGLLKGGNKYIVSISYSGTMDNAGRGIFLSSNKGKTGEQYMAATQFQPMYARNAFPCFDEPALKATFDITIVRWRNMTSLSNMPKAKSESRGAEWEADIYETSVKMSTELVAFIVGKFVGKSKGKITFWAPEEEMDHINRVLDLSSELLILYEAFLGVEYVLPKLDMVPVPLLGAGGMENWGLVFYSKSILLHGKMYDKYLLSQKNVVKIVAHEMAHQWFGNLVTPKWWSDIWLNEGISSYMEHIIGALVFPEYREVGRTLLLANTDVFRKDCLSHSTSTVWKNVTGKVRFSVDNTFDRFAYEKGAVITRMVHYILGNEQFWKLISKYLKDHAYGNVDENDFWNYMTVNPGVNMSEVMPAWTHLNGMPVVSVERNYEDGSATFSQVSCKKKKDTDEKRKLWHIPISFSSSGKPEWNPPITYWMQTETATIDTKSSRQDWILVNGQSIGNYIVNYDRRNWKLLAQQLKDNHQVFSEEQRYKILADANNLRALGYTGLTEDVMLDLLSYLHEEKSLSVFSRPSLNILRETLPLMKQTPPSEEWKEFVIHMFGPLYDRMGWEVSYDTDGEDVKELRRTVVHWLCDQNYSPCTKMALWKFQVWRRFGVSAAELTHSTLPLVLCAAASSDDVTISYYLYQLYKKEEDINILLALGCSSHPFVFDTVLMNILYLHDGDMMRLGKILSQNNRHVIRFLQYAGEQLEDNGSRNNTFNRILRLLSSFDQNLEISEKILEIGRAVSPKLSGWKKQKVNNLIQRQRGIIPKLRLRWQVISDWLSRKPWLKENDEELV